MHREWWMSVRGSHFVHRRSPVRFSLNTAVLWAADAEHQHVNVFTMIILTCWWLGDNIYHAHNLGLNVNMLTTSTKHKVQLRLIGMSLVWQVFCHKPRHCTNWHFDLIVSLDVKSWDLQSYPVGSVNLGAKFCANSFNICQDISHKAKYVNGGARGKVWGYDIQKPCKSEPNFCSFTLEMCSCFTG